MIISKFQNILLSENMLCGCNLNVINKSYRFKGIDYFVEILKIQHLALWFLISEE